MFWVVLWEGRGPWAALCQERELGGLEAVECDDTPEEPVEAWRALVGAVGEGQTQEGADGLPCSALACPKNT